jgi:hypothetical protein
MTGKSEKQNFKGCLGGNLYETKNLFSDVLVDG